MLLGMICEGWLMVEETRTLGYGLEETEQTYLLQFIYRLYEYL